MKRAMGAARHLDPDYFCPSARVAGVKFERVTNTKRRLQRCQRRKPFLIVKKKENHVKGKR